MDGVSGWELLSAAVLGLAGGWSGCVTEGAVLGVLARAAPGVSSASLWAGQLSLLRLGH